MQRNMLLLAGLLFVSQTLYSQTSTVMKFLARNWQNPRAYNVGAAEVVTYDPVNKMAIVSNGHSNKLSFVSIANPSNPIWQYDVLIGAYGGYVNSIALKGNVLAVALEDATNRQNPGRVIIMDNTGGFRSMVTVGAQPDQLTFTPDGKTIIVCNEGEPDNTYTNDPNGSVSIINVTNPASPTVQTVTFTGLNGSEDSLRHMGIRIYGPNATASQDFEPEYAAVSPDGKTAYITLQENNALAIIDIPTATLTRVVALGYKDFSKGLPRSTNYTWSDRPIQGTTDKGQNIYLGVGSGLWYVGPGSGPNTHVFLTHGDRGPNAEPVTVRGALRRPFPLPNYQPEVTRFELNTATGQFTILSRTKLFRADGTTPISGRPNMQAAGQGIAYTDEYGIDLNGNDIPNDPLGADLEGIAVDASGTWWMVDEYRPAIYNFNSNGTLIARYVPAGTAASVGAAAGTFGVENLPAVYSSRRANRGFEAVAIDGDILYAFMQSPLDNPDVANDLSSRTSPWVRILAMNIVTKQVVGEYLYPMHERWGGCDKIGDAVSMGDGKFMVIERDDATGLRARKYLFEINLKGATNIFTNPPSLGVGESLEHLTFKQMYQRGVRPVHKRKVLHLPAVGYGGVDKPEGLARINAHTYAVINDNDFGVGGAVLPNPPNGTITVTPDAHPVLGIITFNGPNGLDASDQDNANNIAQWPVFGMYQPDAINAVDINGQVYLVTANEGDARGWTAFSEERRVNELVLDPSITAGWTNLQSNAHLGRLTVTDQHGDLDGDGDFDELYTLGARSFSVWNADGNLIWDSGSEMEVKTAEFFPNNFNTGHTTNSRDNRSDNKGPEPEAIAVGKINDSTYVFVGCERIGHTFMYNISNVVAPKYIDYVNSRNFSVSPNNTNVQNGTVGDLGCEVIQFIDASESPNGTDLIIAGNEISGTLSIYSVRIPRIVSAPATQMALCIGDVLTLTVNATGPGLTYQWFKGSNPITGATTKTYSIPVTDFSVAGTYSCRVTADAGMTVTPPATAVTVFKRTSITTQPKRLTQVDNDVTVTLTCIATNESGETYQWYKAGVALSDNNKYAGTKTQTLTIRYLQFADTSSFYYCVVKGGCNTVQSRNASVQIPRILITLQPQPVVVCPGTDVTFSTMASPSGGDAGLRYQWKIYGGAFLKDGGRISGAESPTLRITNVQSEDDNIYVCLITGIPSMEPLHTDHVQLDVTDAPEISVQPNTTGKTITLCEGQVASLSVVASGLNLRYQWLKDGLVIPGATDPFVSVSQPGTYRVQISGDCSTASTLSNPVVVASQKRPTLGQGIPNAVNVRLGGTFTLTVNVTGGTQPITYQWYRNGVAINGATAESYLVSTAQLDDAGVYYCWVRNSCGGVETNRCVATVQEVISSIEEAEVGVHTASVDPLPMRSGGTLRYRLPSSGIIRIHITNMQGQMVAELFSGWQSAGSHHLELNRSAFGADGAYGIVLEYAGGITTVPVIVAN